MATTEKKAAPKKAAPKIDATLCRWGMGRYLSPKTSKACTVARNPKRQLCDPHELTYRAAKKAARAVTPKDTKPRSAGTSPKTTGDPMARELAAVKRMKAAATAPQIHAEVPSPGA